MIPREALAPTPAVDRNAETLVPCPAGCQDGMVTIERRRELLELLDPPAELADDDLVELDEPGDEP